MPLIRSVPADLVRRLRAVHSFRRAIFEVARRFDGRLIGIDLAVLAVLILDIEDGRPGSSLGRIASTLGVDVKTVRDGVRRLRWAGYVSLICDRPEGPEAQSYRISMPHESRFDHAIPRQPRPAEIPEMTRETALAQGRVVAVAHDRAKLISRMREEVNGERR